MAYEAVFECLFEPAANSALSTGARRAFIEGCMFGVSSGFVYVSEVLLFYIDTVLITHIIYVSLWMVEVLNLVVFMITFTSHMAFGTPFVFVYELCPY